MGKTAPTKIQAMTCGAKTRSGGKCKLRAGFGTDHLGEGPCKFHTGATPRGPKGNDHAVKHGLTQAALRLPMSEHRRRIEAILLEHEAGSLRDPAAVARELAADARRILGGIHLLLELAAEHGIDGRLEGTAVETFTRRLLDHERALSRVRAVQAQVLGRFPEKSEDEDNLSRQVREVLAGGKFTFEGGDD